MDRERNGRSAALLLALALMLACGCADPDKPERDNPFDPGGTDFHDPGVELVSGPTNNAVIHQDAVTYRWRGTGKANAYNWKMDDDEWNGWSTRDTARYQFLDDGGHRFMLYARSDYGISQTTPLECRFTVDAVDSPALVTVPWHARVNAGNEVSFFLTRKGGGPIARARLVLSYDPAVLTFETVYPGNAWYQSGDTVSVADSSRAGLVDVAIRLSPPGIGAAGGFIAQLMFRARGISLLTTDSLTLTQATVLEGLGGDTLALTTRRGSVVTIVP
jgi:hypothetical protein